MLQPITNGGCSAKCRTASVLFMSVSDELQNSAEHRKRETAHRAHPEPNLCKEDVEWGAIDHTVDFIARNLLCALDVAIAKERDALLADVDNAMHDKGVTCICHHNIIFADVLIAHGAQGDGRATTEEWQHTLSLDRNTHGVAFEQRVAHDAEEFAVGYGTSIFHPLFRKNCRVGQLGSIGIWQTLQMIDRSAGYYL